LDEYENMKKQDKYGMNTWNTSALIARQAALNGMIHVMAALILMTQKTQLLPDDQTLLVHRFSDPLIVAILSNGFKNKGNMSVPVSAILKSKRPATPSTQGPTKSGTVHASSRFELRI
jgi:hypothetical protein